MSKKIVEEISDEIAIHIVEKLINIAKNGGESNVETQYFLECAAMTHLGRVAIEHSCVHLAEEYLDKAIAHLLEATINMKKKVINHMVIDDDHKMD